MDKKRGRAPGKVEQDPLEIDPANQTTGQARDVAGFIEPAQRIRYVADMLFELQKLLDPDESGMLPYLLEVARLEAIQLHFAEKHKDQ